MAHIDLKNDFPGIRGLMAYSPETAAPLNNLAEQLLRDNNNSLSRGERELIATYVSYLNDCLFCQNVHGSIAQHYLKCDLDQIEQYKNDFKASSLSDKMKCLLSIAKSVQIGGKNVTALQILEAKNCGAIDKEIHDTVLISAAFCMYNRYVDGLATWAPEDKSYYSGRAKQRAEEGYAGYDARN
ncbi:MAG: carboxymuconolactone decarboxylase family protein [Saprospiraceae bacterium]